MTITRVNAQAACPARFMLASMDFLNRRIQAMLTSSYHVVFAPKYRRRAIYGELRAEIGQLLRKLCEQKGI